MKKTREKLKEIMKQKKTVDIKKSGVRLKGIGDFRRELSKAKIKTINRKELASIKPLRVVSEIPVFSWSIPDNLQVMWVDEVCIVKDDHGISINFGQTLGQTTGVTAVARIGISQQFLKDLIIKLKKHE